MIKLNLKIYVSVVLLTLLLAGTAQAVSDSIWTFVAGGPSDLSFVSYYGGNDDVAYTEQSFNDADEGYADLGTLGLVRTRVPAGVNTGNRYDTWIGTNSTSGHGVLAGIADSGISYTNPIASPLRLDSANYLAGPTLNLAAGVNQLTLSWLAATGATEYRLYRRDSGSAALVYQRVAIVSGATSFRDDTAADNGKVYYYIIVAVGTDATGAEMRSRHSMEISGRPLPGDTPDAPTGTPDTPTGTPDAPTGTPDAPTGTPDAPTGTPDAPTGTPDAPTGTPDAPADTPETPTDTPETPTGTPETPTDTPETPTGAPDAPTGTPDAPAGTPDAPTGTPDAPTDIPDTPAGTGGATETPNQVELPVPTVAPVNLVPVIQEIVIAEQGIVAASDQDLAVIILDSQGNQVNPPEQGLTIQYLDAAGQNFSTADKADGSYQVTVRASAGSTVISKQTTVHVNKQAPEIIVLNNNEELTANAIIASLPRFNLRITDGNGVDYASLKLYFDEVEVSASASDVLVSAVNNYAASYQAAEPLAPGLHSVRVAAKDNFGRETTLFISGLQVYADLAVQGAPLNYPNPVRFGHGESTTIKYTLTDNAEIKLLIYDVTGRQVYAQVCPAGAEGGQASVNRVTFNGTDDFNQTLGNGVYHYFIINQGKVLGRGQIAVLD